MRIKTVQWNIGGGCIREVGSDAAVAESYSEDGLGHIVAILKQLTPDIVTLQEVHSDEAEDQAEEVAREVGYPYVVHDSYDMSHVRSGKKLGQAILSRFPISRHQFTFFHNPQYKLQRENGEVWTSHNKGVTSCLLEVQGVGLFTQTLHLFPFRKFGVDLHDPAASRVIDDISSKIATSAPVALLQGDFNINESELRHLFPKVFTKTMQEVVQETPTTPRGRRYAHILFRGLQLVESKVITDVLTDHFLVYSEFELNSHNV